MDVQSALQTMADLIRKGDMAAAAESGSQATVQLAIPTQQIAKREIIGRGSESTIYAAQYQGGEVAYKKYIIRCSADLERYRKELALLGSLKHKHIVPLLGGRALPPDYAMLIPRYDCSLEVSTRCDELALTLRSTHQHRRVHPLLLCVRWCRHIHTVCQQDPRRLCTQFVVKGADAKLESSLR
jgi:hypothetical protein